MNIKALVLAGVATAALMSPAMARDEIRIVGSSTVFPFSTKVAQEFEAKTGQKVVIESTGSGGGHKLFCAGVGTEHPDITNSSRRQKKSELETCAKNGVTEVIEVVVGFDGIVIASARSAPAINLTLEQVYLAFASDVPAKSSMGTDKCVFVPNPYVKWSDIDPSLPGTKIEAYGPPPTSGTRDAFVELAMDGGAAKVPCMAALKKANEKEFEAKARTLREDGGWIDAGENDNAIVQTLVRTPTAVGVFGYSFLDQNVDKIKGASIAGVEPTFDNIAGGKYPVSRSLYFYIKKQHVGVVKGIQEYATEFVSDAAAGADGYLAEIGLIPLPEADLKKQQDVVKNLTTYSQ